MINTYCTAIVLIALTAQLAAAQETTGSGGGNTQLPCIDSTISMGVAVGALIVLEIVTIMGWICTAVMQWNKLKPKMYVQYNHVNACMILYIKAEFVKIGPLYYLELNT